MSDTIKEIGVKVLEEIGRLPDGQVAPAGQLKRVETAYTGLYQELLNDSLVNWSATDDIPDFAVDSIVFMLAGRVATRFGVPNEWRKFEDGARMSLAGQIASPYVPQTTQFEDI